MSLVKSATPPAVTPAVDTGPAERTVHHIDPGTSDRASATTGTTRSRRLTTVPRDLLTLLRPGQWAKNLLVIPLPLVDAPTLGWATLARIGWAVLAFTLASSLVYAINDLLDRNRDRMHPVKRHRPIASGRVSPASAVGLAVALAGGVGTLCVVAPFGPVWPVLAYLAINLGYSAGLKHVPLVDVIIVAAGFVLRALQGYLAVGAPVAHWLLLCVLAVCLMLILGKRRHEIQVAGAGHRPALGGYTTHFIDHLLVFCAALTVIAYLLYLGSATRLGPVSLISAPCALFTTFRYLQVVLVNQGGGNPVRVLLRDRAMLAGLAVWAALLTGTAVVAQLATPG